MIFRRRRHAIYSAFADVNQRLAEVEAELARMRKLMPNDSRVTELENKITMIKQDWFLRQDQLMAMMRGTV